MSENENVNRVNVEREGRSAPRVRRRGRGTKNELEGITSKEEARE